MTNSLIPVFNGSISNASVQLCNARELHTFLESKYQYTDWVKTRISEYGFQEDEDYIIVTERTNGRPRKEYHITLDMGKELAMVERNEKGRQIRKYFIECERQVLQNSQQIAPLAPETLTPEEQLMVQNAVKATHERTGLSYGEIWARTKNKFKVAEYKQIKRTDLRDALIYIASMSAIRTAGKDEIIVPANIFAAIMQHTRLARKLAEKVEPFHRQLQEMIGIDRWYKNDIAALAYDVRAEFNYFLEKGEELVEQNRREQNEINFANARLKKII